MLTIQFMSSHAADPRAVTTTWPELAQQLATVRRTDKPKAQLPAWVPAKLDHTGQRRTANTIEVALLVLDIDGATREQRDETLGRLSKAGIEHVYHSTYSYDPIDPQGFCYRVIIPLTKPVPAERWKPFRALCVKAFGATDIADKKTQDPCRLYYLPLAPEDGPEPDSGHVLGNPLDTDLILSRVPAHVAQETPKIEPRTTAVTMAELARLIPNRIGNISNPHARLACETLEKLVQNEPYAESGERNNALFALSGLLALKFPWHTAEAIVDPISMQIDMVESDNTSATLIDMIHRRQEQIREELKGANITNMRHLNRTGPYTPEEIETYLKDLGLASPEELSRQLVINFRGDIYVFFGGDYIHCGNSETASEDVARRLEPALTLPDVILKTENSKGVFVPKTLKQLVHDYGVSTLRHVVPTFTLQTSHIDFERETFYHAIRPRRKDLSPGYSARVEQYLERMIPSEASREKLLDWLATAPKLERPTAGLFLEGPPGTGKTLLASGLAAIWGEAPTELAGLGVNFNGDITGNPVVFADESLPIEYKQDTGLLRKLITAQSTKLRRKYMQDANLKGSVRVIIARNNLDLFIGNQETLTQHDIEALCQRLLHVETSAIPAPPIQPDEIARHVLWLEQTRQVVPADTRLWVRGEDSPLHRNMRVASRGRSIVCQWIMGLISRPRQLGDHSSMFRLAGDGAWINPRLVYDCFSQYLPKENQIPLSIICRNVAEISDAKSRGLYRIRLDDLHQYAYSNGWDVSQDELQAMIVTAGVEIRKEAN